MITRERSFASVGNVMFFSCTVRESGSTVVLAIEGGVGFFEATPLDGVGKVAEGVIGIDKVFESCLEELKDTGLVLGRFLGSHRKMNLQGMGRKTSCFQKKHCKW
jgi:hypothetical protein